MPNLLLTSFGATWSIIPELIGFTNPQEYDFYRNHPDVDKIQAQRDEYAIRAVHEVWLAATNGQQVSAELEQLKTWIENNKSLPTIRVFSYKNLKELNTIDEINPMADLIYRLVLHAKEKLKGGKLYLSLAGGRKSMSANMQEAAAVFGCDALLHVMSSDYKNIPDIFKKDKQYSGFYKDTGGQVACFYPFVLSGKKEESPILYTETQVVPANYPLKETMRGEPSTDLYDEINKRQKESANTLFNLYRAVNRDDPQNSYLGFQLLHPRTGKKLREERIGADPQKKESDLAWLKKLPKADLHCHFGGILSPPEMIEVANENGPEIKEALKRFPEFKKWVEETRKVVNTGAISKLLPFNPKKNIRERWAAIGVPEPIGIAAFLTLFSGKPQLLRKYIYDHTENFKGVGIKTYEQLGDLQGSSLMQNEKSIRKACQILKRQCKEHNIKYLELRCSPVNYTREGLSSEKVVEILVDELNNAEKTLFKLIFIASRHGQPETIKKHIKLALKMRKENSLFEKMFVGFDLAGAESVKSPQDMRETFMDILQESIPTTIHAGEDMDVQNIWEAIYHLSAERIGHGLTLNDNTDLKQRIKERKIAIELCPSSNDQIIGYRNYCNKVPDDRLPVYPLKEYLKEGLKITMNTDDPGISLTTLTDEYYKAACMAENGLSKWELLQINRNGFKYGFLPLQEKKELILEVEKKIFELLSNE